ncbi:hypothetical protein Bbelb_145820 [Branchiostoma belcheri]|nr:hypothetical protein Bbelb_145820 [Branchiostoma belcheri]
MTSADALRGHDDITKPGVIRPAVVVTLRDIPDRAPGPYTVPDVFTPHRPPPHQICSTHQLESRDASGDCGWRRLGEEWIPHAKNFDQKQHEATPQNMAASLTAHDLFNVNQHLRAPDDRHTPDTAHLTLRDKIERRVKETDNKTPPASREQSAATQSKCLTHGILRVTKLSSGREDLERLGRLGQGTTSTTTFGMEQKHRQEGGGP